MKKFVLIDSEGEIVSSGSCEDCDFEAHAIEGLTLLESDGHSNTHYFLSGEKINYTFDQMMAKMDKPLVSARWSNRSFIWEVDVNQVRERTIAQVRIARDAKLVESDVMVLRAYEEGKLPSAEVKKYRKALRDIPLQKGFPELIEWPTPPTR